MDSKTFERVFEIIKQFYNVTTCIDYGIMPKYKEGKWCLPDKIMIRFNEPSIEVIFQDKPIQKFLQKAQISEAELETIITILKCVNHLYIKFSNTKDMSNEEFYYNDPEEYFKYKLESELRELHRFCCKVSDKCKYSVETVIETGFGDKIELSNYANYIFRTALKKYCEDHVPDLKGKTYTDDTNQKPIYKNKGGRPTENYYTTSLLYGTFLMLKSYSKDNTEISDGICRIIYRFFRHMHIDTYIEQDENVAIKTIRARIKTFQKKSYKPNIGRGRKYKGEEARRLLQNSGLGLYNDLL